MAANNNNRGKRWEQVCAGGAKCVREKCRCREKQQKPFSKNLDYIMRRRAKKPRND